MVEGCQVWQHNDTWIIADHEGQFDVNGARLIFHVGAKGKRIRFVGENSNSENWGDKTYNLELWLQGQKVYSKALVHTAGSRWTKNFWLGTPEYPDFNFKALIESKKLPNYDLRRVVPEAVIAREYNLWLQKAKDLYDSGNWAKDMNGVGGRPDIGPFPTWDIQWLYTKDARMREKALGNADLACAWPIHYREGRKDKFLDRQKTVPGFGRIMTISTRPTFSIQNWGGNADNKPKVTGPITTGGWLPDAPHAPGLFFIPYLLTGDYFYLEELMFWAGYLAMTPRHAPTAYNGRGPTGVEGGSPGGQTRGEAWRMARRIDALVAIPKDWPEWGYFHAHMEDHIAIAEGQRGITGTAYDHNANWTWANKYARLGTFTPDKGYIPDKGYPPLHQWEMASEINFGAFLRDDTVEYLETAWMQWMIMYVLGRAKEQGYQTQALLDWSAKCLVELLTKPGINRYLAGRPRMPVSRKSDGKYFQTWIELQTGYLQIDLDTRAQTAWMADRRDGDHGYPLIAMAACAMVCKKDDPAWIFMRDNCIIGNEANLDANPKWAILPRS